MNDIFLIECQRFDDGELTIEELRNTANLLFSEVELHLVLETIDLMEAGLV